VIPNLKLNSLASAAIIVVAAVAIPMLIAQILGVKEISLTAKSAFVGAIYVLVIVSLLFSTLGKRGPSITSGETDAKISATYSKVLGKLQPVLIAFAMLWLLWLAFQYWRLYGHAK
jgi:hypothetical protein